MYKIWIEAALHKYAFREDLNLRLVFMDNVAGSEILIGRDVAGGPKMGGGASTKGGAKIGGFKEEV